jgi:hypothetical protein
VFAVSVGNDRRLELLKLFASCKLGLLHDKQEKEKEEEERTRGVRRSSDERLAIRLFSNIPQKLLFNIHRLDHDPNIFQISPNMCHIPPATVGIVFRPGMKDLSREVKSQKNLHFNYNLSSRL